MIFCSLNPPRLLFLRLTRLALFLMLLILELFVLIIPALAYSSTASVAVPGHALTSAPILTETPTPSAAPPLQTTPASTPTVVTIIAAPPTLVPMVPYSLQVKGAELVSPRFISTDTVAYLRWGRLYRYHLPSQTARPILDSGDVTSFAWFSKRQEFALAKGGQLMLLDASGTVMAHLSNELAARFPSLVNVPACDLKALSGEDASQRINLLNSVVQVTWSPDQNYLEFVTEVYDGENICSSTVWLLETDTGRLADVEKVGGWLLGSDWLNSELLMVQHYEGGVLLAIIFLMPGMPPYVYLSAPPSRRPWSRGMAATSPTPLGQTLW